MDQLRVEYKGDQGGAAFQWRDLAVCIALGASFGLMAFASIEFTRGNERVAAVWIPNALIVAFLLRSRLGHELPLFAAVFAGNIGANLLAGDAAATAAGLAASNLLEIWLAVSLVRQFCGPRPDMHDIGDLARFIAFAAIVAPIMSACVASLVLIESGSAPLAVWSKWAVTDGLGMAIITPAALILIDAWAARRAPTSVEAVEWAGLTIVGTTATFLIFAQTDYPLLFLIAPIVLSHAFRLGPLGTAFSVIKVSVIATYFTTIGQGPINMVGLPLSTELIMLQAFIATSFLIGLPIAAVIAGRTRMISQIELARRELALLADNVTDAVLRYDLDGICTYASRSVRDVLGERPESFLGNRASDRAHPDALEKIRSAERRLLSGEAEKERFTYRRFLDSTDCKPVYIEADCAVARNSSSGVAEGIVVSARDVTERVELELQLVRARRHAENAARAKSEFLANMSHEIRTPMNGVLGFAELLQQSSLSSEQKRHAELIVQSGRSMMLLLNDILDLSKIEAGQIVIEQRPVDLRGVIDECAALHRASAEKKGLEIEVCGEKNCPWIMSDGLRLRQIVLNLIGNAVKFTESGSVTVSYAHRGEHFTITVEDTGIGISEDRLERIFNPFEQGESDTSRRFGGTGLGLSISRQLAELLDGTLDAESQPSVGSRFILTLPFVEASHGPTKVTDQQEVEPKHLPQASRILLAEDHDVNRLLVTEMLQRCGQKVEIAHDGNEAVAAALEAHMRGQGYDLVLMDVQMPGCDGYAATRAIRAEGIRADVLPIVALTANAFPEDIAAARDAGMQAHLAKPLVFSELVATLQRWLPTRIVSSTDDADIGDEMTGESALPAQSETRSPAITSRWQERRREALDAVNNAVRSGKLTGRDADELARLVHKLAGTAGMFGEDELGQRAAAFERALRSEVDHGIREELARDLLEAA